METEFRSFAQSCFTIALKVSYLIETKIGILIGKITSTSNFVRSLTLIGSHFKMFFPPLRKIIVSNMYLYNI